MFKNGKDIKCKICNKEFYISGSRIGVKKYCSFECAKKDDFGFKPKNKNCSWCGEIFLIKNSLRTQDKYCSNICKSEAFKEKQEERNARLKTEIVIGKCKECQKSFEFTRYFKRIYCSNSCRIKYMSKNRVGENNPAFKNGLYTHANFQNRKNKTAYKHLRECARYRKEFISKHGYQFCEICKINANGTPKFEVHHIYFASQYPKHKNLHNNRNLVHICLACHHKFHSGKTYEKEFRILEKERKLKTLFTR